MVFKRVPLIIDIKKSEFAYVVGVFLGDGSIRLPKGEMRLNVKDKEFATKFKDSVEICCNIRGRFIERSDDRINKRVTKYQVNFNSINLAKFIQNYKDKKQYINDFNIKEQQIEFLRGMYDSEGNIFYNEKKWHHCQIRIVSTNKELLQYIYNLLNGLGFDLRNTSLVISVKKGASMYNEFTDKTYYLNNDTWRINLSSRENVIKFKEIIGFIINKKQQILNEVYKNIGGNKNEKMCITV